MTSFVSLRILRLHSVLSPCAPTSCRFFSHRKVRKMADDPDEITIGSLSVVPRSVSGLESTIVVRGVKDGKDQSLHVTFDLGYAARASISSQHVFISHGHIDHIGGIASHASKRSLYNQRPATYYIPPHLEKPLQTIGETFMELNESESDRGRINTCVVSPDSDPIQISNRYYVRAFPTHHRVTSQGYIIYKREKRRKPEYAHLKNEEMKELVKNGIQFNYIEESPLLAYTGDTMPVLYDNPANPDLLKVPVLITESTYIDDSPNALSKAEQWGHTHLQNLIDRKHLFKDVGKIILVHFSDKYSVRYIRQRVSEMLPQDLKEKIVLGVTSLNRP